MKEWDDGFQFPQLRVRYIMDVLDKLDSFESFQFPQLRVRYIWRKYGVANPVPVSIPAVAGKIHLGYLAKRCL